MVENLYRYLQTLFQLHRDHQLIGLSLKYKEWVLLSRLQTTCPSRTLKVLSASFKLKFRDFASRTLKSDMLRS
jgi:hypothetical protein